MQAEQITDDECELRFAIVEHQAASVQLIMNIRARIRRKAAHDLSTEFWRDVGRGGSGAEFRTGDVQRGKKSNQRQEKAHEANTAPTELFCHGFQSFGRLNDHTSLESGLA
jgi:hypothetical protein